MTYEEIAETMELPLSTVKTRLFRAVNNSNGHWRNGDEPTSFATTTASVARDR